MTDHKATDPRSYAAQVEQMRKENEFHDMLALGALAAWFLFLAALLYFEDWRFWLCI